MKYKFISLKKLLKTLDSYKYRQLHIHHTWKPDHSSFTGNNHVELQEIMARYHKEVRKWDDIGQHITIFPDGKIVTGRDFAIDPCSIKHWNKNAFAVELVGNFDIYNNILEGAQLANILRISAYFSYRFGLQCVKFHNEGPETSKTCPGSSIIKQEFLSETKEVMRLEYNIKGVIFNDVGTDRYTYKAIDFLSSIGIFKGDGKGNFHPDKPLTREQAAIVIDAVLKKI